MTTSSRSSVDPSRWRRLDWWRRRGAAPLAVLATALVAALAWSDGRGRAASPVLAFVDPSPDGAATAVRVVLLVATALTAGIGLARPLTEIPTRADEIPDSRNSGVRAVAWVSGLVVAGACAGGVVAGVASAPLAAVQLVAAVAVPLLLASARPAVAVGALLAGLLAVELGTARAGLPLVLDVAYALAGAVLLGASCYAVAEPTVRTRARRLAVTAGAVATVAGVGQLLATGPHIAFDVLHTGYGLAAVLQAVLPVPITLAWLLAGGRRAGEAYRLGAGGLALAFAAAALLATLPRPAAAPEPGHALLRPVELPLRRLAVQVLPMRPGPNLVHIGATAALGTPVAAHHGDPPPDEPGTLTVAVDGGTRVPVTPRPGAPGGWAVLDIPAGATKLTVTADGTPATVPVDVGTTPADPSVRKALTGPDGPECASAALATVLTPRESRIPSGRVADFVSPPTAVTGCPSQRLTPADADALRDTVGFLAGRGITALAVVADDSPRALAAAELVRAEATRLRLPLATGPAPGQTLLVLAGWAGATDALRDAAARAVDRPDGGIVLAPWLLAGGVLGAASSEVLPLRFNPQEADARHYAATVVAVFPGERPSAAGYLAWAARTGAALDPRATFYGAAPVNVPMGAMDSAPGAHGGANPAAWYPDGTVVPINPPLGP